MPAVERTLEVDTEVMLALVDAICKGISFVAAAAEALREVKGDSFALLSSHHAGLILATANGSMYVASDEHSSSACLRPSEAS